MDSLRLCTQVHPVTISLKIYFANALHGFFLVGYSLFRYKFDDERVTKEDTKKALEEQYGGEEEVTLFLTTVHSV